jgi:hypothetical protein
MVSVTLDWEELMKNARPSNMRQEVERRTAVERLLGTYSVEYIIDTFHHVTREYGYSPQQLREMAPECVERRRRELRHDAAVAELMGKMVGAEGD